MYTQTTHPSDPNMNPAGMCTSLSVPSCTMSTNFSPLSGWLSDINTAIAPWLSTVFTFETKEQPLKKKQNMVHVRTSTYSNYFNFVNNNFIYFLLCVSCAKQKYINTVIELVWVILHGEGGGHNSVSTWIVGAQEKQPIEMPSFDHAIKSKYICK